MKSMVPSGVLNPTADEKVTKKPASLRTRTKQTWGESILRVEQLTKADTQVINSQVGLIAVAG